MAALSPPLSRPPARFAYRSSTELSIEAIQHGIEAAACLPLALAQTIPPQAYTSEEYFGHEAAKVLAAGWQCIAHASQLPRAGDFLNLDLLGELLIVVRGKDEQIRVLSRVCPHRSMDIMPPGFSYPGHGVGCGHAATLLCPYHAWSFGLDGQLKACPEMQGAEGFRKEEHSLRAYATEVWQGFVFVNLSGDAAPLASTLAPMADDVAPYRLAGMEVVIAREWQCEFNWKVLVENFMESYHHLGIHHRTLQPLMPARQTWTEQERPGYIRAHLPYREELPADTAGLPLIPGLREEQTTEWGLYLIPPSFLLATAPDRVIWYRILPEAGGRLSLLTTVLIPREEVPAFEPLRDAATQQLVDFHLEDMEVCTAVQRGLGAAGAKPGRLSHLEMPVWLFHRYLAARNRGEFPTESFPAAESQRPR